MAELSLEDLERSTIANAVAERVCRRAGGAFAGVGPARARELAETSLVALEQDIAHNESEQGRASTDVLVEELASHGLTFSDLRLFNQTLRKQVREVLGAESGELPVEVEDWFYESLMVASLRFMAWRDEVFQKEAAKLQVHRLESQLAELEDALKEKIELLELVRQASTPIAPVVQGILVVPLVGTFDAFRAEALTEKLLAEITRLQARTAILDISGVPVFDTDAAQMIIRLARAVRMLGAAVLLVGMSPNNARTIVSLGVNLTDIESRATLREGLAHALAVQRMHIAPLP